MQTTFANGLPFFIAPSLACANGVCLRVEVIVKNETEANRLGLALPESYSLPCPARFLIFIKRNEYTILKSIPPSDFKESVNQVFANYTSFEYAYLAAVEYQKYKTDKTNLEAYGEWKICEGLGKGQAHVDYDFFFEILKDEPELLTSKERAWICGLQKWQHDQLSGIYASAGGATHCLIGSDIPSAAACMARCGNVVLISPSGPTLFLTTDRAGTPDFTTNISADPPGHIEPSKASQKMRTAVQQAAGRGIEVYRRELQVQRNPAVSRRRQLAPALAALAATPGADRAGYLRKVAGAKRSRTAEGAEAGAEAGPEVGAGVGAGVRRFTQAAARATRAARRREVPAPVAGAAELEAELADLSAVSAVSVQAAVAPQAPAAPAGAGAVARQEEAEAAELAAFEAYINEEEPAEKARKLAVWEAVKGKMAEEGKDERERRPRVSIRRISRKRTKK